MTENTDNTNWETMSDEEFLQANIESDDAATVEDNSDTTVETIEETKDVVEDTTEEDGSSVDKSDVIEEDGSSEEATEVDNEEVTEEISASESATEEEDNNSAGENEEANSSKEEEVTTTEEVDYKQFYESVINKPIRANGKEITLKNADEVVRLIQKGAGFGKAMQDIAPHRKLIRMLGNNDLLDEDKLNFLIDLNKKDKSAIAKLVKDADIDTLDIPTGEDVSYTPGNHKVSDLEENFNVALSELKSAEGGVETLQTIHTEWDDKSKDIIFESPDIFQTIHEQRTNGIYDQITTELSKQRVLGKIKENTPFLEAYIAVGDSLASSGELKVPEQNSQNTEKKPIAEKVAAPKSKVKNSDKANAAAITKNKNISKSNTSDAALAKLSDDEFIKLFDGRL